MQLNRKMQAISTGNVKISAGLRIWLGLILCCIKRQSDCFWMWTACWRRCTENWRRRSQVHPGTQFCSRDGCLLMKAQSLLRRGWLPLRLSNRTDLMPSSCLFLLRSCWSPLLLLPLKSPRSTVLTCRCCLSGQPDPLLLNLPNWIPHKHQR